MSKKRRHKVCNLTCPVDGALQTSGNRAKVASEEWYERTSHRSCCCCCCYNLTLNLHLDRSCSKVVRAVGPSDMWQGASRRRERERETSAVLGQRQISRCQPTDRTVKSVAVNCGERENTARKRKLEVGQCNDVIGE